jgi:hypothetical protein
MEETYTTEDALVQYMYREMPADDAAEMAHLLDEDPELHAMFTDLMNAKTQLPKVQFNPSSTTIQNILTYSTKTALEAQC